MYVIESATNALKLQEKGESVRFFKHVCEIMKKDMDTNKG